MRSREGKRRRWVLQRRPWEWRGKGEREKVKVTEEVKKGMKMDERSRVSET